jgi:hypothetical protein
MSLTVLCPTRGRFAAAREAYASFIATTTLDSTIIFFVINSDEDREEYDGLPVLVVPRQEWMNEVLAEAFATIRHSDSDYIGFIGDDNRFKTVGWDARIVEVLDAQGGGFAYGNDLARHDIPTHVFASSRILKALGWLGLPGSHHLYLDNTWKVLGDGADCLYFIPDIIIDHLHPFYGKGEWDDSYRATNAEAVYSHDRDVFTRWLENDSERDIQTVRNALGH